MRPSNGARPGWRNQTRTEVHAFLKEHGVYLHHNAADLEHDLEEARRYAGGSPSLQPGLRSGFRPNRRTRLARPPTNCATRLPGPILCVNCHEGALSYLTSALVFAAALCAQQARIPEKALALNATFQSLQETLGAIGRVENVWHYRDSKTGARWTANLGLAYSSVRANAAACRVE